MRPADESQPEGRLGGGGAFDPAGGAAWRGRWPQTRERWRAGGRAMAEEAAAADAWLVQKLEPSAHRTRRYPGGWKLPEDDEDSGLGYSIEFESESEENHAQSDSDSEESSSSVESGMSQIA